MCYSCNSCASPCVSYSSNNSIDSIVNSYSSNISQYFVNSSNNMTYNIESIMRDETSFRGDYDITRLISASRNISQEYNYTSTPLTQTYSHGIIPFARSNSSSSVFIGDSSEIKDLVIETFRSITKKDFPKDIVIRIIDKEKLDNIHSQINQKNSDGVLGFAINRKKQHAQSEIFIKKNTLDKVILTLGHEIGHVLSFQLDDSRNEEAKAFAFEMCWLKKIKELNIGGLSTIIDIDAPAKNGLHDIALDFVIKNIREGKDAFDLFLDISRGKVKL